MAGTKRLIRGIFCIETVWFGRDDKTSMRPMLQWLHDVYDMPFIHRDAVSRDELFLYLNMWGDMKAGAANDGEKQYPILILSYHGDNGGIWVTGDPEEDTGYEEESSFVELDEIEGSLEGRCKNKVIHFASCSTINVSNAAIGEFLEKTQASAVSGYAEDVDWTWSMAFDLLYLQEIQDATHMYLTPKLMKGVSDRLKDDMWENPYPYDAVRKRLGFDVRERTRPA